MKKILLIGLGGTIACSPSDEGLVPTHSPENILERCPGLQDIARIDSLQLMTRTVVYPEDWQETARVVARSSFRYDGFVVTMGTDTLAYASSMLSFMLQGFNRPLVITGAMRPIEREDTDAVRNLTDAVRFAGEGPSSGVHVVFNGRAILGCRASKTRCNSAGAFESINFPYIAEFTDDKIVYSQELPNDRKPPKARTYVPDVRINTNVITVTLNPQTSPELFALLSGFDGFLIEAYGDGNVSDNLIAPILRLLEAGKAVVIASRCPYEATEHKYRGGKAVVEAGAISSRDMTKEAALTKLMRCLGRTNESKEVKRLMQENCCGEIMPDDGHHGVPGR